MTILRRKKKHDPNRHMVLICDRCFEREELDRSNTHKTTAKWAVDHNWRSIENGGRIKDYCPKCERLTFASAAYFERLHT